MVEVFKIKLSVYFLTINRCPPIALIKEIKEITMSSQYEAFIKCPKMDKLVNTGYKSKEPSFNMPEKPHGVFNCPLCHEAHHWSYEEAQILEIHT